MRRVIIVTYILFSFFNHSLINAQEKLKDISIAVHWLPQAQFSGFYVGVEKGIYEKHGLNVKVLHSTPNITSQELLLDGKVDFATLFLTTALVLKSNNAPIVNVGQMSQKCGQVLVTKNKDIKEPSDINGKKIGIWRSGFDEVLLSFVNEYNLNVEIVLISSTINLFLFGGIDLMTTMWYNEYHSVLSSGIDEDELNSFFFADYGFNIPEDGIYMIENRHDNETIEKFLNATLEAWEYAFNHKEETLEFVKKEMQEKFISFNKPHQVWMLNRIHDLFQVKDKEYIPGQLLRSDFDNAYKILMKNDKLVNDFTYEDFYYGVK